MVKDNKKNGFLGGFHGTPLCTNGSAGYFMQLSVKDVVSEGYVILEQKIRGYYSSQDEREQESGRRDGMCLCR